MKCIFWSFIIFVSLGCRVFGLGALDSFTQQANESLQSGFGFGVTNLPVYSTTDPTVNYSASIHYLLQCAANAYDATTPATNLPSVFRPLFCWQSNVLYIVGYTCVSNDFYTQIGGGFKALTDPTISTNDNVWGIPWVVGAKGQVPAFNEYCHSSAFFVGRDILFVRSIASDGQPNTNMPPQYTNVIYSMTISNMFGAEAWNFYPTVFSNSVTIVVSNQVTVTVTNNYNYGATTVFSTGTNWVADGWAGHPYIPSQWNFKSVVLTNATELPLSYWSESSRQFVTFTNGFTGYLPADLQQTGWPEHEWMLNITNNLMYCLIDNATGQVLDFVNLGAFGSSLNVTQTLTNIAGVHVWDTFPANDAAHSPMSVGVKNQIGEGIESSSLFYNSLTGASPCIQGLYFVDPYVAYAYLIQNCSWHAANPLVHYTVGDLTDPQYNQSVVTTTNLFFNLSSWISDSVCTLGKINPDYDSGAVTDFCPDLSDGLFQIGFLGTANLPYAVWGSTDLQDWNEIAPVTQPVPGVFQYTDPDTTAYPARFYQLRLP
jgi:hypothetical protein